MNKYVTELIGTFFLVLTVGCTVIPGATAMAPMEAMGSESNTGVQTRPASVVFHTPPTAAPK